MRRPAEPERLYLDFDGFFASVEQAARPSLRGRPVGVVPFEGAGDRGILIACSREAKEAGVKSIMSVQEARRICGDLVLVPQSPDLYRRAHNALVAEIMSVIPIAAIKSIDEMTADIEPSDRADPMPLIARIKDRIRREIGPWITCSIGVAANRQLAKMACKAGKRVRGRYGDGHAIWHPRDMPGPLLSLALEDVPGVGARLKQRLHRARIKRSHSNPSRKRRPNCVKAIGSDMKGLHWLAPSFLDAPGWRFCRRPNSTGDHIPFRAGVRAGL
jgi:DNA polymerase IV